MNTSRALKGYVSSGSGEVMGRFVGCVCQDRSELFCADHFSVEDFAAFSELVYPVAYLRNLRVESPNNRGQGYGTQLIQCFRAQAVSKRAQSAMTRVADPETPEDILVKFYSQNGWRFVGTSKVALLDLQVVG